MSFVFGQGGSHTSSIDCSLRGGLNKLTINGGDAIDTFTGGCADGSSQKFGVSKGGSSSMTADCSTFGGVSGLNVEIGDFRAGANNYRVVNRMTPICANGSVMTNSVGRPGDLSSFKCPQYETIQQISGGYGDLQVIDQIGVRCGPLVDCNKGENRNTDYCKAYCTAYPDKCDNSALLNFCTGNNLLTQQCVTFCNANPEQCDQKYRDFCAKNPNNYDVCGCLNFDPETATIMQNLATSGLTIYPTCMVRNCSLNSSAFRPSMYKNKICPNQTVCHNQFNAQSIIGQSKGLVNISMACGDNQASGSSGSFLILSIIIILTIFLVTCTGSLSSFVVFSRNRSRMY